jgi:hypothetical protein
MGLQNEKILKHIEVPTMKQIAVRILLFLEKVALKPGGRLTLEVLRSNATVNQWIHSKRAKRDLRGNLTFVQKGPNAIYEAILRPCTRSHWIILGSQRVECRCVENVQ